jgi:hypothetical protein
VSELEIVRWVILTGQIFTIVEDVETGAFINQMPQM